MPVQTTNSIQTSLPGLQAAADFQSWLIASGVLIHSDSNSGFEIAHSNVVVLDYGNISSFSGSGVSIASSQSGNFLLNAVGASISGLDGIDDNGNGDTLVNDGSVVGSHGVGVSLVGGGDLIHNSGSIYGPTAGVWDDSFVSGGSTIVNTGEIQSADLGVFVETNVGFITTIINSGTIEGDSFSIQSNLGAVHLKNSGLLVGDVSFDTTENDTFLNSGHVQGSVSLGGGNDTYNGSGGGVVDGTVFGGDGNDRLIGGARNDSLSGGPGNDTLTGGGGHNEFIFDAALGPSNIDTITDFAPSRDVISLSHAIFTHTNAFGTLAASMFFEGAAAHDASDRIIYNPANGFVTYDSNGNHPGGAIHFATLADHLTLTHADFLVVA